MFFFRPAWVYLDLEAQIGQKQDLGMAKYGLIAKCGRLHFQNVEGYTSTFFHYFTAFTALNVKKRGT